MILNISADPSILTINTSTAVTFTVITAGVPVDNATVTLGGVISANRTTGPAGSTVINVSATHAGKISAVASKEGYAIGTTVLTVTGGPSPLSNLVIIVTIVGELVLFVLTSCGKFECPEEQDEKTNADQGVKKRNKPIREISIIGLLLGSLIVFIILGIIKAFPSLISGIWGGLPKEIQEILTFVLIALGTIIFIVIIYGLLTKGLTKESWQSWKLNLDLKWFNITPSMFISFSVVWISSAVWLWGSMENDFLIATLGAGVLGGIIYDIVVNKGDVILPKVDPDGISLGALYGGALGFASAIMVINSVYQTPSPQINLNHSLLAFLSALGLKGFSEFSATAQLMVKKKASISFNLKDDKGNIIKEGTTYPPETKFKADGEILVNEKTIGSQVVHLNFQKDCVITKKDITTNSDSGTAFVDNSGINLDVGTWIAWASWDGNDTYDKSESRHQKFEVK